MLLHLHQIIFSNTNNTYEQSFEFAKQSIENVELMETNIEASLIDYVQDNYSSNIKDAIKVMAKKERYSGLKDISKLISEDDTVLKKR